MGYRYLLFDADGTLLDFDRSEDCALRDTLLHYGLAPEEETLARYRAINDGLWRAFERGEVDKPTLLHTRWQRFLRACGREDDPAAANAYYMARLGAHSFTYDGAAEVCAALAARGHTLALITNGTEQVQRARWGVSPAAGAFSQVFISDVLGVQKPDARFFELVLSALGDPPRAQCLVIGDSESSDMAGGAGAHIDTCWYNPAHRPRSRPWTHEIAALEQLLTAPWLGL